MSYPETVVFFLAASCLVFLTFSITLQRFARGEDCGRKGRFKILLPLAAIFFALPAQAAPSPSLSVTPITWDIVGLDSNSPTKGPQNFPVGVKVCSSVDTTNVLVNFVWDSPNTTYITLNGPTSKTVPAIAAGQCAQVYFQAAINPVHAAFQQSRGYHITADDLTGNASSPVPRQLYVESLISQQRNSIQQFYLDGVLVPLGGSIQLVVGNTYTFAIKGGTATQGYEQLASYLNLPSAQFEITSTSSTYSANNSPFIDGGAQPATTDILYANACGWDANPSSPNYRTCVGGNYKTGGSITNTYTVKVIAVGGTAEKLSVMIYDFSGSSYHYNNDFSQSIVFADILVPDPKLALTKIASPQIYIALGTVITYNYVVTNTGNVNLTGPFTVSDDKTTVTCPATPTSLIPGASIACTGIYTIVQNDIDTGSVTNSATATGGGVTSPPVSETVFGPTLAPSISLTKNASSLLYKMVGDVITYSYLVANTGNETLAGPFTVTDDKTTVVCPSQPTGLPPLGTLTCVGTYAIKQADIDAGFVTNTATAAGGGVTSLPATETVFGPTQLPALRLVKTGVPQLYSAVGQTISYDYVLTNSGNVTLTGPFTVADDKTTVNCPATATLTPLPGPASTMTCTGTYTIRQADIDAGVVTNSAMARAGGSDISSPPATETVSGPRLAPSLSLGKTASPTFYTTIGDVITYSYLITNNGNETLTGPFTVSDNKISVICPPAPTTLPPLGVMTCLGTYTIKQSDIDAGSITNIASARAAGSNITSPSTTLTIFGPLSLPSLSLVKTASPLLYSADGQTISYSYVLTNTGNVTLRGPFTVNDNKGAVTCPSTPTTLSPLPGAGASVTCTGSYTIHQADIDIGSVTNVATATAVGSGTASPPATQTVNGPKLVPSLSLAKTADPVIYTSVGDVITYRYLVTNTGNATLNGPFTVNDNRISVICPSTSSLSPFPALGSSIACTGVYTITQTDINAGSITNAATATGGGVTSPLVTQTIFGPASSPLLRLTKTADPVVYAAVGETIHYSYQLTNIGNITLQGPFTVTDNKTTVTCPPTPVTLAPLPGPGASITCTGTYTITQADINGGSVTNIATGTAVGSGISSLPATQTVNGPKQTPTLSLTKTPAPLVYATLGQQISYSYQLTNTGNVTLTGPFTVADNQTTVTCPSAPPTLTPLPGAGASTICLATYTIKQTDIDAGSVTNIATAKAEGSGLISPLVTQTIYGPKPLPLLRLSKTASPLIYTEAGQKITYSYLLTNAGNVSLTGPFSVDDDKTTVTCPSNPATLKPLPDASASITCTGSYTITQGDINSGSVTNIATATAVGSGISSLTATQTVNGPKQAPSLSLAKTASPLTYTAIGNVVSYSYLLTNTGNVSLTGPFTVTDDQSAVTCPSTASLPPLPGTGASITCTSTHVIDQSDMTMGSVTNTAIAQAVGSGLTSPPVTQTVFGPKPQPLLGLAKTATPLTYSRVGQEISYSYLVTNIGNVPLSGPFTVADDKSQVTCPSTASLTPQPGPGSTITCNGKYVITQADLDVRSVTNIAVATAEGSHVTSPAATQTVTAENKPRPPNPIPTLNEWAQILMMFLMIATAGFYGRRMKQR